MIIDADLMHAPPRLSDLRGEELRAALWQRHYAARSAWRAQHERAGRRAHVTVRGASRALTGVAVLAGFALIASIAPPTIRWIAAGAPSASVAHLPATPATKDPAVEAGRVRNGRGR